jgi:hypothetical protein
LFGVLMPFRTLLRKSFVNFPKVVRKGDSMHPKQNTPVFLAKSSKLLPIKHLFRARKIENIPRSVWFGEPFSPVSKRYGAFFVYGESGLLFCCKSLFCRGLRALVGGGCWGRALIISSRHFCDFAQFLTEFLPKLSEALCFQLAALYVFALSVLCSFPANAFWLTAVNF